MSFEERNRASRRPFELPQFLRDLFRPPIRPVNTVPSSIAGSGAIRPRPIRTGFTITGKSRKPVGKIGQKQKFIKQPPVAFVRNRVPDVELTRKTGLTPAPVARPRERVSTRSRVLTEPVEVVAMDRVPSAEIGSRRKLSEKELARARKASPKAVDPNLVRLRNRRTPRVPPVKKRLIGGGSFGGIRARGVGRTQGGDIVG